MHYTTEEVCKGVASYLATCKDLRNKAILVLQKVNNTPEGVDLISLFRDFGQEAVDFAFDFQGYDLRGIMLGLLTVRENVTPEHLQRGAIEVTGY
jgi:hypothetical protein